MSDNADVVTVSILTCGVAAAAADARRESRSGGEVIGGTRLLVLLESLAISTVVDDELPEEAD